ncbi:6-phosphogluconate dehydrogenase C-terminal domain-like protein [Hymenopellis radicata]|nr:6-phosphogluconate dehydrogenase C-terminal domain-like protein [Hymenopellis radicata]
MFATSTVSSKEDFSGSPSSKENVLVIGLGAVGALYAFLLQRSGVARVTVVARSNHDLVSQHGINIHSRSFGNNPGWKPDRLCRSVAEAADTAYRYTFLATKCVPEILTTPKLLEPLLTSQFEQPTYVLLQNGLGIEKDLYEHGLNVLKKPLNIVNTAIYLFASQEGPNTVAVDDAERVEVGIYRHSDYTTTVNSDSELRILNDVKDLLVKGGSNASVVPEIQRQKFHKNMYNVVFAATTLLTRYAMTAVFRSPPPPGSDLKYAPYVYPTTGELVDQFTVPMMREMFNELITLGRALGFPDSKDGLPSDAGEKAMAFNRANHDTPWSFHKPSTLLDCEKGVPMEIDVIWGSVVRLARERGVAIPRIEMAYSLLVVMQNQILRQRADSLQ